MQLVASEPGAVLGLGSRTGGRSGRQVKKVVTVASWLEEGGTSGEGKPRRLAKFLAQHAILIQWYQTVALINTGNHQLGILSANQGPS